MSEEKKVEIKLLSRILVEGEGQKIGTKIKVSKNEAIRLVNAGKATFNLDAKTPKDPTDVEKEKAGK